MRLVIQIPCFNEKTCLPQTISALPRRLLGIDEILVLVIDDGSTDGTSAEAERCGAHYVVRLPHNQGLSAAYMTGIDACYQLAADIVVNTDADNQYCAQDIEQLIAPILAQRADLVVGDRNPSTVSHFSFQKKLLQRWGSAVVRFLAGVEVNDVTSGFRALNRRAVQLQFVHNRFTYTLETLIAAGAQGLIVASVPVRINPPTRQSRLFRSLTHYLWSSIPVILRSYCAYSPGRLLTIIAAATGAAGALGVSRFLVAYLIEPTRNGHIQALQLGVFGLTLSVLCLFLAVLADLLSINRRLIESVLIRTRDLEMRELRLWELEPGQAKRGIHRTNWNPWQAENNSCEKQSHFGD